MDYGVAARYNGVWEGGQQIYHGWEQCIEEYESGENIQKNSVQQAGCFDPLVDLPSLPRRGDMQLISWRKLYLHYSYTCLKHLSKCLGCILQCGSGYWDFLLLPFGTVNWKKVYQVIFRSGRKCSRKEFYPIIVLMILMMSDVYIFYASLKFCHTR